MPDRNHETDSLDTKQSIDDRSRSHFDFLWIMARSVRSLFVGLPCTFVRAGSNRFSKNPQFVMSGKTYFRPIEALRLLGRDRLYPRKGCLRKRRDSVAKLS